MRKGVALVSLILLTAAALASAYGQSQEKPAKPIPKLTTDDTVSSPGALRNGHAGGETTAGETTATGEEQQPIRAISWESDLYRARELASDRKGVVVVDVYTDWCQWCHKMDEVIYSNPKVAALSAHNVFVKLNAEDKGQGEDFARQSGVTGYPTTIILDSEGNRIQTRAGFISNPDSFISWVEQAQRAAR